MKDLSKLFVLLAMFTLGAYAGAWSVSADLMGNATAGVGVITITIGALVGLLLGGLLVLLWD